MAKLCAVACLLSVASSFVVPRSARSQTLVVRSKTYDEETDVNVLMTALNAAVAREDFREASSCKKRLDALRAARPRRRRRRATGSRRARRGRGRPEVAGNGGDCVIAAPTGSGKTLAFLVPLLGAVEGEMMRRERRQLEASSNLGLLTPAAAMAAFSPALWTSAQVSPPSRPPQFGPRRGAPLALVLAPSRALAVQLATATFSLVGGTNRNKGSYFPGDKASLFAYEGPKGARVVALASDGDAERAVRAARSRRDGAYKRALADGLVFDEGRVRPVDETQFDDLEDCDVLVADARTLLDALDRAAKESEIPNFKGSYLGRFPLALEDAPDLFDASALRLVAVDEADAIAREARDVLDRLGDPPGAARLLVGASLGGSEAALRWRPVAAVGARRGDGEARGAGEPRPPLHGRGRLPAPPRARAVPPAGPGGLGGAGRRRAPSSSRATRRARSRTRCARRSGAPTPWRRCCRRRAARPSASFGAGDESGDDFAAVAAVNAATLLVTVPSAARGLDFPNVSTSTPSAPRRRPRRRGDLAPRRGRCGRVGQAARGVVTTLGGDDDRAALEGVLRDHFEGVEVADAAPPPSLADEPLPDGPLPGAGADADAQRAYLEDVFALRDVDDGGGD
ncbi:helicase [Aureococcus anophagefferens]|nr:helicase [Aureococcus anophagefferens]